MPGRVRVFIATSLDGFIAGPDHDLSWLPEPRPGEDFGYEAFMARTGAILMGRSTYEIAAAFDPWPYGETPVLVATRRELDAPAAPTVEPVSGTPQELVGLAHERAVGRDIYLDGGDLIRQVLDAGLVDELDDHGHPRDPRRRLPAVHGRRAPDAAPGVHAALRGRDPAAEVRARRGVA